MARPLGLLRDRASGSGRCPQSGVTIRYVARDSLGVTAELTQARDRVAQAGFVHVDEPDP
ncbi:MAG TPA: hypothetical protein VEK07_10450 [Polyangiaceae bacterium]|nr:hypothetical protein [Polyangiaceae bacterium]